MKLLDLIAAPPRRDTSRLPRLANVDRFLACLRLDGDLPLDMLSSILTSIGTSVLNASAWLHEDVHTLLRHPRDIASPVCWAALFLLASLGARIAARFVRQQRAASQGKTAVPVD